MLDQHYRPKMIKTWPSHSVHDDLEDWLENGEGKKVPRGPGEGHTWVSVMTLTLFPTDKEKSHWRGSI